MTLSSITVCIPTYNQSPFLRQAVESVLAQRGCEVEVYISDDGSTDDTSQVMSAYSMDVRVHYYRQPRNQGIAANSTWVMQQGSGEFLVRLDSDDLLAHDYCSTLVELLRAHPKAAVAHAAVKEIDQHGAYRRIRRLRRSSGYQEPDNALRYSVTGYGVAANICMFRRSALAELGTVYRPGMNFCEDWDLFARLTAAGWGNLYCGDILASYRVWLDVGGYRKGRKLTELNGALSVYTDTLAPAFKRRGWPLREIKAAQTAFACGQVRSLRGIPRDSEDFAKVRAALIALGDGPGLRFCLGLIGSRMGWALDIYAWANVKLRDIAKALLGRRRP